MSVKLLTEHHLEFLSFKGGCRGSSESTHVKMPHCWKSHVTAQINKTSDKCAIVYLHGPVGPSMSLGMFENEGEILKGVFLPVL